MGGGMFVGKNGTVKYYWDGKKTGTETIQTPVSSLTWKLHLKS
jgi:hypothetical protein